MEEKYNNLKRGERGALLSILAYIVLSILKLVIGYFANSQALTADGLNNTTDIISSIAVLIGLKIARKPADDDHRYGHWRAETISSLVASFIMIAVGINVLFKAVRSIIDFKAQAPDLISAFVGIFCSAIIYIVYRFNLSLAKKINSQAVMAAAKDNLSDAWVGIGTSVGIIASQFGLPWIDPLAALVVGFLICKTAWEIFREATHNLTDGFDKAELDLLNASIKEVPDVIDVKDIRARIQGNNVLVDVVVTVDPDITVAEGHDITVNIEKKLIKEHDISEAIVHVEPKM